MRIERFDSPERFLRAAGPLLRLDEARNQLALGVTANAAAGRTGFEPFRGWIAGDPQPAAAAVRTPPRNVVLGEPTDPAALEALVEAVAADAPDAPGATGNVPVIDAFVRGWTTRTGDRARTWLRHGVFAVERVQDVPHPAGEAAPAAERDVETAVSWFLRFAEEALPREEPEEGDEEEARRGILERLPGGESGLWF